MIAIKAKRIAEHIYDQYYHYDSKFKDITRRASMRFENRDQKGFLDDTSLRLCLRDTMVQSAYKAIARYLNQDALNMDLWIQIKKEFYELVKSEKDNEIAETYYNSIVRKVFSDQIVEELIMFVNSFEDASMLLHDPSMFNRYNSNDGVTKMLESIIEDVPLKSEWFRKTKLIKLLEECLTDFFKNDQVPYLEIEIAKSLFFRNQHAYLVGLLKCKDSEAPFVIPIVKYDQGLMADTLVLRQDDVSQIFSFTRAYFMVDTDFPFQLASFLKRIMPGKRYSDLYNSIGYDKHGKTVLYRSLLNYLDAFPEEKFVLAPGIKGMVMSVFTLPGYDVVFKLIKDKFDPPKKMNRAQVIEKYELVKRHDKVGRMADTHAFSNFFLPLNRISEELLIELKKVAPSLLEIRDDKLMIRHMFTERKMIPLNLYLENCTEEEAEQAIEEYGNAIKELAAANIFAGDMLLKNFGVTRHKRVVFYDYDEICFLTECNFRKFPQARTYEDELSESWFSAAENDIFPEEFKKFLIGKENVRNIFFRIHADLFDVAFWKGLQQKQILGILPTVYPYPKSKRFVKESGIKTDYIEKFMEIRTHNHLN